MNHPLDKVLTLIQPVIIKQDNEFQAYLFKPNDRVSFVSNINKNSRTVKGVVISYDPTHPRITKRLLVRCNASKRKENISLYTSSPIEHQQRDIRERLYIQPDDHYKELHQLMGTHIVMHPLVSINESISTLKPYEFNSTDYSHYSNYFVDAYVTITKIIAVTDQGYLYLGKDNSTLDLVFLTDFRYPNGVVKTFKYFNIDKETYDYLLTEDDFSL